MRKLRPGIVPQNGMCFPLAGRLETASQFERLFRDAVSAEGLNRKACPVPRLDSGTRFPLGPPYGKPPISRVQEMGGSSLAGKRKSINVYGRKSSAACEMTRERRWFPSDYSAFIRKSVEISRVKVRKSVEIGTLKLRKSVAG